VHNPKAMTDNDSGAAGDVVDVVDVVDVWLLDLSGRDVAPLLTLLDPGERARADRYASVPARRLFVASRAAQRILAARYLDTDPRAVRLDRRCPTCGSPEHGRPTLPAAPDLDFSVSHTKELVALAFRPAGRVGLDVEALDRNADIAGLARTVLTGREAARLGAAGLLPALDPQGGHPQAHRSRPHRAAHRSRRHRRPGRDRAGAGRLARRSRPAHRRRGPRPRRRAGHHRRRGRVSASAGSRG
jgi:hypothetical protein